MVITLSKSSLNCYLTCPKLYEFLYVKRIESKTSPASQRGLDFHTFCYDFYDNIFISGSFLCIDDTWLEEQRKMMSDDVAPFVENFLDFEKKRWEVCLKTEDPQKYFFPVLREQKLTNKGLGLTGIVDRIDLNFDNKTYTVLDYKTEKYDTRPWKLTEHRREMAVYKVLIESTTVLKGPVTHFCIYYPRSNDVWTERFNTRTLNALDNKLKEVREEISKENFPCFVSYFCRYCECNKICEME